MRTDLKQKILDATNNGLDVLLYYYPQARDCVDGKAKAFKIRPSETDASAYIKHFNDSGEWKVTDFGEDQTARNCFDVAMYEEGLPFSQVLHLLAQRYKVESTISVELNKCKISSRKAADGEKPGDFTYVEKDEFSKEELDVFGPFVSNESLKKYNYVSLESYTIVKNNAKKGLMAFTFTSSEDYPIFMRKTATFEKIYKPLEPNKAYRFFYHGTKPQNFINGMDELVSAHAKYIESQDTEFEPGSRKSKLTEVFLCSGERDAMNCAGMGHEVLWLNSETARFSDSDFVKIQRLVERVYNIPDIDSTGIICGRKLALEQLDMFTIELPSWLRNYKDARGGARKDLRDYLELRPFKADFDKLVQTAKRCRFWEIVETKDGKKRSEINTAYLLYYLKCNGFAKLRDDIAKVDHYVRIAGYKIYDYDSKQIRGFVLADMERRMIDTTAINLFLNSKRTGLSIADDLDPVDISFVKSTINSRTFFFENCAITVEKDRIIETDNRAVTSYTWSDLICPHVFKRCKPSFTTDIKDRDDITLNIENINSHLFRFLINTSRIYWRDEFEVIKIGDDDFEKWYMEEFKYSIFGSKLTPEQKDEQKKHLLNKMYMLGYLLHKYKLSSNAIAPWIMENKLTQEDESSGGSGKSFIIEALGQLKLSNIVTIEGRDKKVTDNKHLLERVTRYTDILVVDDARRGMEFDFFYTMITGKTVVNPKRLTSFELDFKESPIIVFTSNFPIPRNDSSTMRRILPVVFSDYYHAKTPTNGYKESRSIRDDFGKDLFGDEYTEAEYNADINFLIDCLQFYLQCSSRGIVVTPPMDNVVKRINLSIMGDAFKDWADFYLVEHLNRLVSRVDAFNEFCKTTGNNNWKMQRFSKALQAWCDYRNDIVETLNPKKLLNSQGRLVRKTGGVTTEFFYIQEIGHDIDGAALP